ncbi:aromatic compound dioxygenase [Corynespora cassiicola Philippines]|uniref:Aromatic compound dioxygenase n=1 Tax=Corynespora cassiicola Philippines TaxID=1448308 RepID=A0A2T2N206_CORCC|nr:aromatic compound dioxygenase [Corynespora cassiicola Philippines]
MKLTRLLGAALLLQQSIAHPGQSAAEHAKEIAERRDYLSTHKRSLAHCAEKLKARGNDLAMQHRRNAKVDALRAKRSIGQEKPYLRARDLDSVLSTDHASNLTGITLETDPAVLFSGNNSCILTPEVTQGPYYVQGELVRQDITEDQEGVSLHLDIQLIDVNTCEPVPQAFLEIWHCNSTGVYSGVAASGNGDSSDLTNLDATFLRGIQQSDDNGVVQFDTLFPGHYTSRATHIHVLSHSDSTLMPNNTLSGGTVTHVGQVFADQDLIALVETQEPYASNTQELTTNAEDSILSEETATDGVDPVFEYVLLGDDVSEGIFGWIAFGFDNTNSFNITPAAYLTENGGVENENSSGGMGGGSGGPPSGAAPSGAMPTGALPSGAASDLAVASTMSTVISSSSSSSSSLYTAAASSSTPSDIVSSSVSASSGNARPTGKIPGENQPGQQQDQQGQKSQQDQQPKEKKPSKQNAAPGHGY